jgi:hypothetical protein
MPVPWQAARALTAHILSNRLKTTPAYPLQDG